jgi:hypothetical protein
MKSLMREVVVPGGMAEGRVAIGSNYKSSIPSLSSLTEASSCIFASTEPRQVSKYVASSATSHAAMRLCPNVCVGLEGCVCLRWGCR